MLISMNQALIEKLNDQLNREVTTFLRYMLQAALIKGAQNEPIRQMYIEEVKDEVQHAQDLANQIVSVGGVPELAPDLTPPPKSIEAMLANDIEEEQTDVGNYMALSQMAEEKGFIALKMAMEEQAADEDQHGQLMRRLLG